MERRLILGLPQPTFSENAFISSGSSLTFSPSLLLLSAMIMIIFLISSVSALPEERKWAAEGGRCGPEHNAACNGMCCSGAGYCGKTEDFCSVPNNCQRGWGWCDSNIMPHGADVTRDERRYISNIPVKVDKCTLPKTLALTFDDGPSNYTNDILDVLKEHKARATFFVAGVNNGHGQIDIRWTSTVRRMIMEGHQVGSHTWSHPNLDKLSSAERKMEMWKNDRAITNIIGKMPTFVRPPMVICGDACMKDMKDLAVHVVSWQVDSQDWHEPQPSVQNTTTRLIDEMHKRQNMFLIQHDTSSTTVEVLKSVLEHMPTGWKAVPLVECLGHSLDDAFRYPEWLEYNGVAEHGCLVSAPASCIEPQPFNSITQCVSAANSLRMQAWLCKGSNHSTLSLSKPVKKDCVHIQELSEATMLFCKECKDDKECNHDNLKFRGYCGRELEHTT